MENDSITIRNTFLPSDLELVALLHGKVYGEEHGFPESFEKEVRRGLQIFNQNYDPEKDRVWVVEKGSQLVGFILLFHREENQAQLRYFILDKSCRGTGIGKRLMEEWMSFFREKKYDSAYLYTTSGLDAAVSLYEKHGFVKVSEETTMNFGFPMLEILFRLDKG